MADDHRCGGGAVPRRGVLASSFGGQGCLSSPEALRGSGVAAPQGALRAIDPCGAAAILADLRSAPPEAAIRARPGCHAG